MFKRTRLYFDRKKAIKSLADDWIKEHKTPAPVVVAPTTTPQTTFVAQQTPPNAIPQPSNTPPVVPASLDSPVSQPVPTPHEVMEAQLNAMNDPMLNVINKRLGN